MLSVGRCKKMAYYSCSFYYFVLLKKTGEPELELVWTVDIRYCPVLFPELAER